MHNNDNFGGTTYTLLKNLNQIKSRHVTAENALLACLA